MQSLAAARRSKPKIVKPTHDSDEEEDNGVEDVTSATESIDLEPPAVVPAIRRLNRPALGKKGSGSKLKLSFGGDDDDGAEEESEVFVPKRSMLSKKVSESKGPRKFGLQVYLTFPIPISVPSCPFLT